MQNHDKEEEELRMWQEIEHFVSHRDMAGVVSSALFHFIRKVETTGKGLEPSSERLKIIE